MSDTTMRIVIDDNAAEPQPQQNPTSQDPQDRVFKDTATAGESWAKLIGENKEALAALAKLGYGAQQTAVATQTQKGNQQPGVSSLSQEAMRRLERIAREKEIDREMRSLDADYERERARLDEEYARRRELRLSSQQERDEDYAARQDRRDAKQSETERARQEARQERDEDYAARQELRDWKLAQREVKLVPEAIPLHDDEAYRRQAREAMANRERSERAKEIRREIDPKFVEEENDRERKKQAQLLAMGGAAIGGRTGRMMGAASQVLGSPETMRWMQSMLEGSRNVDTRRVETLNKVASQLDQERRENAAQRTKASQSATQPASSQNQPPSTSTQAGMPPQPPSSTATRTGAPPPPPPSSSKATQAANAATSVGNAASASGAASSALAGVTAAVPIVGAIIAVAGMIQQEVEELGERRRRTVRATVDTAKSVISGDADSRVNSLVQGFDSVANAAQRTVPILGAIVPPVKEVVHGLNEMRGSVRQTAERFAQYNGILAGQVAQQEVTELLRDIRRANQMGNQLARTNQARFNMEQKVQDIADRFMPAMLRVLERIFGTLEGVLTVGESTLTAQARAIDLELAIVESIPGFSDALRILGLNIGGIRAMIREWLDGAGAGGDGIWDDLRALGRGIGAGGPSNVNPMTGPPGPVIGAP